MGKKNNNATYCVHILWQEGFFITAHSLKEVSQKITDKWGHNFFNSEISKALASAKFLICSGKRRFFTYKQKISPVGTYTESIEEQLFSDELIKKFGVSFEVELQDLRLNFRRSGNCTAFLLRKILEKAIYLAFAKNNLSAKLQENTKTGRLIGLEAMVDASAREKMKDIPFLLPKTAEKIRGIKFLGDISAHNPLVNVDMETILPQMPFIITAYKELAERL